MHRSIRTLAAAAVLGTLAVSFSTEARAQGSASQTIQATAVVAEGLAIANLRNLSFGTVFPGIDVTIAPTDPTSGHFRVLGGAGAQVQLTFPALPSLLADGGGNDMSVSFTATENPTDAAGTGTACDTGTGCTATLDGETGQLHVYIGGTVSPGDPQAAGNYSATVTLNAAYTGN
jgi:spore coat protein U-like protein